MQALLFTNWWNSLVGLQQLFWSMALVASLLLCIVGVISLFGTGFLADLEGEAKVRKKRFVDARWVFVFFAAAGWTGAIALTNGLSQQSTLIWAALVGLSSASIIKYLLRYFSASTPSARTANQDVIQRTGEVLQSVPPHRNGFGKVHLDIRESPYEFDAITAGHEIPPGAPVRIVDIIDDRVVLVEPINKDYPGQR